MRISLTSSGLEIKIKNDKIHRYARLVCKFRQKSWDRQTFRSRFCKRHGNIRRPRVVPKFSDLVGINLRHKTETIGPNSESHLFSGVQKNHGKTPNLVWEPQPISDEVKVACTTFAAEKVLAIWTILRLSECRDLNSFGFCRATAN